MDPQHPTAELLIWAYTRGIFPMAGSRSGEIEWFSPDPRGVIPLDALRTPRRVERAIRSGRFELRTDTAFEQVMRECARATPRRPTTWIDERLIEAYVELHQIGAAHSFEAWRNDRLVGGLYGVHLGGAFFGESMFHRPDLGGTDASKVCLVSVGRLLRSKGFSLFDTQLWSPHLDQFGCIEIPRERYMEELESALARTARWPSQVPTPTRAPDTQIA